MTKPRQKNVAIHIPASLYMKLEKHVKNLGFDSVSSYVTFVIQEIVSNVVTEKIHSKEEEEKIKNRLKALGYLR